MSRTRCLLHGQGGGEVDGGRGLAHAAFLVRDGDDFIRAGSGCSTWNIWDLSPERFFCDGQVDVDAEDIRGGQPGDLFHVPDRPGFVFASFFRPLRGSDREFVRNPGLAGIFRPSIRSRLGDLLVLLFEIAFILDFGFDVPNFFVRQRLWKLRRILAYRQTDFRFFYHLPQRNAVIFAVQDLRFLQEDERRSSIRPGCSSKAA